jgi:hypothetical protein
MAMSFFKGGGVCPVQLVENSIVTLLTNQNSLQIFQKYVAIILRAVAAVVSIK